MFSKSNSKKQEVPFYAFPFKRKSSAEIIQEAKDEIRKMASCRPGTPASNDQQHKLRPPSSASQVSFSPERPKSRPLSAIRLRPLRTESASSREPIAGMHLEPTVLKTSLTERKSKTKLLPTSECSLSSSSISLHDVATDSDSRMSLQIQNLCPISSPMPIEARNSASQDESMKRKKIGPEEFRKSQRHDSKLCLENAIIGVEYKDRPVSNNEELRVEKFETDMWQLLPQLEKLMQSGKRKSESQGIELMNKLRKVFEEAEMFQTPFEGRLKLLRLLFKLLDSHCPTLSFHVIKLVLEMRIADKNMVNVCKLLYKLCQEEKNIVQFLSFDILGPFLECLRIVFVYKNPEALKFGFSLLCILAANDLIRDVLGVYKCHEILLHHLHEINEAGASMRIKDFPMLLIKLITALRYFAEEEEIFQVIISSGISVELFKVLNTYRENEDIIVATIKLMSKISDSKEGCLSITACDKFCDYLAKLLHLHKSHLFIVAQVTFIVGSIVEQVNDMALSFYSVPGFVDYLLSYLKHYFQNLKEKRRKHTPSSRNYLYSSGDHVICKEDTEIMLKVCRVFANMCLCREVGSYFAEDEKYVLTMLKFIEIFKPQYSELGDLYEPLASVLVVINNITYFMPADTDLTPLCIQIAEGVLPLLNCTFPIEVRIEACNIVRNITRIPDVRFFMLKNTSVPAIMSLLDEYDNAVAIGGYAIVMNLLLEKRAKEPFYKQHGVTKLLRKLHLCLSRDWDTAALLCQVMWNYCSCEKSFGKPLTQLEIQHLIKVLQFATGSDVLLKTDDEHMQKVWEHDFCTVAKKLLALLVTFV